MVEYIAAIASSRFFCLRLRALMSETYSMNDLRDVFKLSAAERLELAEDLWDSIAADTRAHPPLTDAQRSEIEKRLAEHAANPSTALSWDAVRAPSGRGWTHSFRRTLLGRPNSN